MPTLCACGCGRETRSGNYVRGHWMKGQKLSAETRLKQSASQRGHVVSPLTRQKLSASLLGRVVSDVTRDKIREARQRQAPPDTMARQKMSEAHLGRRNPWAARPDSTNTRTTRWRARAMVSPVSCAWAHIGHCKGPLDVAHLDQNPLNNALDNLLALCRSHHFLFDKGRIDRHQPQMPPFYTDRGGTRRYL